MSLSESSDQCPAMGSIGTLHSRLARLEELLVDGLSRDIGEHLDSYVLRLRRMRSDLFPAGYFSDVMWDILLELHEAHRGNQNISVSDLGLKAGIPSTTAQRYLATLEKDGIVIRREDATDNRRFFISLSPDGVARMDNLLTGFVESVNADLQKARLRNALRLVA